MLVPCVVLTLGVGDTVCTSPLEGVHSHGLFVYYSSTFIIVH